MRLAGTGSELIAARIVQGVAAACMAPQVLATFRVMFTSTKERGQAFAVYGAMLGFASAIGLVLGGVLTDANLFGWSWRAVFFVNVPVAVGALVAGLRVIPETRDPAARRPNYAGAGLLAASMVAIVYPLLEGRQLGWPGWVWPLLATGVAGVIGLAVTEERRASTARTAPMLRARLLRAPAFAAGLGVQAAFAAGLQGFFLVFALWLQLGEHFTPLKAGLTAVAFSAGSFVLAPVAVPMAQKYGRRVLVTGGAFMAGGIALVSAFISQVGTDGSPWPVVPGLVVAARPVAPGDPAGERRAGGGAGRGRGQRVRAVQHDPATRRRDRRGGARDRVLRLARLRAHVRRGAPAHDAVCDRSVRALRRPGLLLPRTAVAEEALLAEGADTDAGREPQRRSADEKQLLRRVPAQP